MLRSFLSKIRGRSRSRRRTSDEGNDETVLQKAPEQPGLFHLNEDLPTENESISESYEVDIVAVHGLNGTAFGTWTQETANDKTHAKTSNFWLKDFLPKDIPGARIFTYSYPSHVLFSKSKATTEDYAQKLLFALSSLRVGQERRPIIFIAHSLGGIVCKQALILAREDPNFNIILDSTVGVFFFGTPHRGARGTPDMGIFLGNILDTVSRGSMARWFVGRTRTDLLGSLKANSPDLRRVTASFSHLYKTMQIVTVYETEEQAPIGKVIVDQDSAIMGIEVEKCIPRHMSHTEICKFASSSDNDYKIILKEILDLCKKACYAPSITDSEKACVRLFNACDVNKYRSDLKHVDGTCKWILNNTQYQDWAQETQASLLWITGHAGSGKTILSSYITKHIGDKATSTKNDPIVCFFFCNGNIEDQRDATPILRSIISQILTERGELSRHVKPALGYDEHGGRLFNSYDRLWSIFTAVISDDSLGPISIVIDALDECKVLSRNRLMESILELIGGLRSTSSRCIKFLVTSRPETISNYPTSYELQYLPLEENQSEIDGDLRLVIRERVKSIGKKTKAKPSTIALLEGSLTKQADRTFLWIRFAFDLLDKELLSAPRDIERILAEFILPPDLESMYERFLEKVQPNTRPLAYKLLCLIIASFRPLSLDEINIMISTREATRAKCQNLAGLEEGYLHTNMEADIRNILGSLVRISGSKVYMVHISLKEFLCPSLRDVRGGKPSRRHHIDIQLANLFLASACMAYLSFDDFKEDLYSENDSGRACGSLASSQCSKHEPQAEMKSEERLEIIGSMPQSNKEIDPQVCANLAQRYQLLEYSATYWPEHFAQCQELADQDLRNLALRLSDKQSFQESLNWFRFFWTKRGIRWDRLLDPSCFDQIVVAGYFDHFILLKTLLHRAGSRYMESIAYALYWASRNGNVRCVNKLLQTSVDPDSVTVFTQSCLCSAADLGHIDVVRALVVDNRADINFKGRGGGTPLSCAASNGHTEIVKFLLSNKQRIEADAEDGVKETPLFWAISGNHPEVARILIAEGQVNVNHINEFGFSPFSLAAAEGAEDVIQLLLDVPSLDIHRGGKTGLTPLAYAAKNGHAGVIGKLNERKALDISHSHRDENGHNAYFHAAWRGYATIIRVLHEYHVPGIDEEDGNGWTPLFCALECHRLSVVKELLQYSSVDVNHRDRSGRTALSWAISWAISHEDETGLRLLLASPKIDPSIGDNEGRTPLDWARSVKDSSDLASILDEFER